MRRLPALFVLLGAACGSEPARDPPRVPTADGPEPPPSAVVPAASATGVAPQASAAPSATPASAPPKPAAFPPPAFKAPVERTAKPGDGTWSPVAIHRAKDASSPLQTAIVHPHKIRPFVIVQIVAIDLSRLDFELVGGTHEPEGTKVPVEKHPGIVPPADLEALVAVTNGGFKKRHGEHGIAVSGEVLLPPKTEFCTVAKTKAGAYRVGTWTALEPQSKDFAWWRQGPPCLVEGGKKHPDLANEYKAKKWGGAEDGNKEIRRSAIGVGGDPGVLYFAIGDWVTAEWLADGLVAAGITTAVEMDINYSYTRFIVYERGGAPGELVATSPLLQELKAPRKEYWKATSERDFFYLKWR